ncbi:uncharacterized protein L201_000153 [Kwoniella dendrophila CBS 6074]|uniref:Uncharacterized protein n=1 Tax=Kwoniella dendrophila CBS 6074 TaxID=1295534 RepID=A0AAX4JIJ1_9TREE
MKTLPWQQTYLSPPAHTVPSSAGPSSSTFSHHPPPGAYMSVNPSTSHINIPAISSASSPVTREGLLTTTPLRTGEQEELKSAKDENEMLRRSLKSLQEKFIEKNNLLNKERREHIETSNSLKIKEDSIKSLKATNKEITKIISDYNKFHNSAVRLSKELSVKNSELEKKNKELQEMFNKMAEHNQADLETIKFNSPDGQVSIMNKNKVVDVVLWQDQELKNKVEQLDLITKELESTKKLLERKSLRMELYDNWRKALKDVAKLNDGQVMIDEFEKILK